MATFSPKKIDLNAINNGVQFNNGDGISAEAINAPIEASAFAQALATNKPRVVNDDGELSIDIEESTDGTPVFVFENLVSQNELAVAKDNFYMDLDNLDNELRMIIAGKQDKLTIDTEVTEGSENPVTSGAVYEALQGIGGGGGSADGEVEPLPNTLVLRDENGFADVLTPEISWGQALDENQAHKAVNAETLNDWGFVLNQGCNAYTDSSIQDVSSRIDQEVGVINRTFSSAFEAINSVSNDTQQIKRDVDFLYTLVEGTVVAHETIEDTFASRVTGGGIAVIDNTPTTVQKVQGTTRYSKNLFDLETAIGGTKTVNGITCVANNNTLTFSGTPTLGGGSFIKITNPSWMVVGKTYLIYQTAGKDYNSEGRPYVGISCKETSPDGKVYYSSTAAGNKKITVEEGYSYEFTFTASNIPVGTPMTPITIPFMAIEGSTALPYEDYAEGAINTKFSGIVSQNADGTKQDTLALPSPIELGAFDYIDVENQQLIRQTHSFAVADVEYGSYAGVTSFGSKGNYYLSFTFNGLPTVVRDTLSKKNIRSNYYEWGSVTTNANTRCIEYSSMSATGASAPRFDFRDDELVVKNDDGTVDKDATIEAFKAKFAEIGLQIAYKIGGETTEYISCPSTYTAYSGGTETIIGGDEATVTQEYYVKVGG